MTPVRLAIGLPCRDMVNAGFALSLAKMCGATTHPHAVTATFSSIVAMARNGLVAQARDGGASHLLMIDTDMGFPDCAANRLMDFSLSDEKYAIVGAGYRGRPFPHRPMVYPKPDVVAEPNGLIEVDRLPAGMLLVDMRVFEALEKPIFRYPLVENCSDDPEYQMVGEDYAFCDRARAVGFRLWMDLSLTMSVLHYSTIGVRWAKDAPGYDYVSGDPQRGGQQA